MTEEEKSWYDSTTIGNGERVDDGPCSWMLKVIRTCRKVRGGDMTERDGDLVDVGSFRQRWGKKEKWSMVRQEDTTRGGSDMADNGNCQYRSEEKETW